MFLRNAFFLVLAVAGIVTSGCRKEPEHSKADWYTEVFTTLPTKYSKIKIAIVYHEKYETFAGDTADLRINSSPAALAAYQQGVGSDYFIGTFAGSNQKILPPDSGCYVGVFPGWGQMEDSVSLPTLEDFETLAGKGVAFAPFSNFWGENYSSRQQLDIIANYGAVPMLRLMPWGDYWVPAYESTYALQKIIDGDFDPFLADWATDIKEFSKPVMATFGVEMNGNWFPWSGWFQGRDTLTGFGDPAKADGPERYVAAFRHIIDLFKNQSVTNVTWYFHPNYDCQPPEAWNSIEAYYPGDDYIDWIAFSLYGAQSQTEPWLGFEEIIDLVYNDLIMKFPDKPLMIAEWGVREP